MRKVIVIFFLCIYVLSATEADELFRLPILVQHFITHKDKDATITFFQFLKLHYENRDSEDYKDSRLPFKSHSHSVFISHVFAIPVSSGIGLNIPYIQMESGMISHKERFLTSAYLSFIWQPPKFI